MAAHFHIACEPFVPSSLGSAGHLWIEMAERNGARVRELVRAIDPNERVAIIDGCRPERLDKRRNGVHTRVVPVPALLLATGHPLLRQAVFDEISWPGKVDEYTVLVADAIRRRDAPALSHWSSQPGAAERIRSALAGGAFPPEWLESLSAPCPPGGDSQAIVRFLLGCSAAAKPMLKRLAMAGDVEGVNALLAATDASRLLIGSYKSLDRHPAVAAFAYGHIAFARQLYLRVKEFADVEGSDNDWSTRIRSGWIICAESAVSALNPSLPQDDRLARMAATRACWVPEVVACLRAALEDIPGEHQEAFRIRLLALARAGLDDAWVPPAPGAMDKRECATLLMGRPLPGALDCLRHSARHLLPLPSSYPTAGAVADNLLASLVTAGSLVECLRRARQRPMLAEEDWSMACTLAREGLFDIDILDQVVGDAESPGERAALFAAVAHSLLPSAAQASRTRF